jgi:hypothetical protein
MKAPVVFRPANTVQLVKSLVLIFMLFLGGTISDLQLA